MRFDIDRTRLESGPPIAVYLIGAVVASASLALLFAPLPADARQRGGLALLGAFLVALAATRPRIWWEHPKVLGPRALFGDRAYVLLHGLLGALFVGGALWAAFT